MVAFALVKRNAEQQSRIEEEGDYNHCISLNTIR